MFGIFWNHLRHIHKHTTNANWIAQNRFDNNKMLKYSMETKGSIRTIDWNDANGNWTKGSPSEWCGIYKMVLQHKKSITQSVNCDNERNDFEIKMNYSIFLFVPKTTLTTKIYDAKITIWNRPLWFKRMTDFDIYFKWETSGLKCEWLCSSSSNRTYVFL